MNDLKITIDQLKNYLGTGLKIDFGMDLEDHQLIGFSKNDLLLDGFQNDFIRTSLEYIKPLCYRLSDLDKFIPELGFVPIEEIEKLNLGHCDWITKERNHWIEKYGLEKWIGDIPFAIIQKLFEWHFWPFGDEYFEAGLVIDKLNQGKEATSE